MCLWCYSECISAPDKLKNQPDHRCRADISAWTVWICTQRNTTNFNVLYQARGSAVCLQRPACKESDYIETSSSCDKDNKVKL